MNATAWAAIGAALIALVGTVIATSGSTRGHQADLAAQLAEVVMREQRSGPTTSREGGAGVPRPTRSDARRTGTHEDRPGVHPPRVGGKPAANWSRLRGEVHGLRQQMGCESDGDWRPGGGSRPDPGRRPLRVRRQGEPSNPDPDRFDCSGLVAWVCRRLGVRPNVPDGALGAMGNTAPLHPRLRPPHPGALLFVGDGLAWSRGAITHVAISRGDGTTIEARSARYGIGNWPAGTRFNFAGLIPGVSYGSVASQPVPAAPAETLFMEDEGHGPTQC